MRKLLFGIAAAFVTAAVFAQTNVTAPVIVTIPGPPPLNQIEAALAADGAFVKAVAAALGSPPPPPPPPPTGTCPATSGPLTVNATVTRTTGISPLLVFFDATNTTDAAITANTVPFQDVTFTWNFGDSGASGTGTWAYGSNPAHNAKNTATGGLAAHVYQTAGSNTNYTATVTATDGTNSASCTVPVVTVTDPSVGFAGTKTACIAATTLPVAGSGGCPSGAAVAVQPNLNSAISSYVGNGKRALFHCGDTFTGDNAFANGTIWSIGAYGGCEGTSTGRPIFSDSGSSGELQISNNAGDGRLADIDFEGNGTGNGAAFFNAMPNVVPYQITFLNLYSNGNSGAYSWPWGAQMGVIGSVMANMRTNIGVFLNFQGTISTPTWTGPYPNDNYLAVLGNSFNGVGNPLGTVNGQEVLRIATCQWCVITNNTLQNANYIGADLKMHNGNQGSSKTWSGTWTEFVEISDNWFGGTAGGQLVENCPQNGTLDERMRYFVFERNILSAINGGQQGRMIAVCAQNETVRDNAFYINTSGGAHPTPPNSPIYGVQVVQRGTATIQALYDEVYNNDCYAPNGETGAGQSCIGFDSLGFGSAAGNNGWAKNNLYYSNSANRPTIVNNGTGNTISNNTANSANQTANPNFTNASGTFNFMTDWKPTANYAGGISVPVLYDALGVPWSPTWDLGAVHH